MTHYLILKSMIKKINITTNFKRFVIFKGKTVDCTDENKH